MAVSALDPRVVAWLEDRPLAWQIGGQRARVAARVTDASFGKQPHHGSRSPSKRGPSKQPAPRGIPDLGLVTAFSHRPFPFRRRSYRPVTASSVPLACCLLRPRRYSMAPRGACNGSACGVRRNPRTARPDASSRGWYAGVCRAMTGPRRMRNASQEVLTLASGSPNVSRSERPAGFVACAQRDLARVPERGRRAREAS